MSKPTSQAKPPRQPPFTEAEITQIMQKANDLFQTIVGLTSSPLEGLEIICMMHMLMYLNYGDPNTTVNDMLESYCKAFRQNYEAQTSAEAKGQLN